MPTNLILQTITYTLDVDPKQVIFLFNFLMFKNNPHVASPGVHDIHQE